MPLSFRFALLLMMLTLSAPAAAESRLPVTVAERLQVCVEVEDRDPAHSVALAESVLAEGARLTLRERAEALGCRGWALASQGQRDAGRRDAHALQALLPQLDADAERVRLARRVGVILHGTGDRIGSVEMYAQAVTEAEALGLEAERIPLLINLGVLHSEFEEHERARVNYEQALAMMDRLGDHQHEAPVRYNLGLNLAGQSRHAEAAVQFERVLELMRGTGAPPMREIAVVIALASAIHKTGEGERARQLIEQVRGMNVPITDPGMHLTLALIESSQLAEAGELSAALALLDGFDVGQMLHLQQISLLRQRSDLLQGLGRHEEANALLRQITELREAFLRSQNHERMAALESHLRDREQRFEMERLQAESEQQALALKRSARRWWQSLAGGTLLLLAAGALLLWQRRMNRRLDRASRTDPLTGLSNRRDMAERLRELSLAPVASAAVHLIDIDLFKRINDRFGHNVGDEVLVRIAGRLQEVVGEGAVVARWGGEEFLVVSGHSDAAGAQRLAERLRGGLARPMATSVGELEIHISVGYASLPLPQGPGSETWQHSLQLADAALYLAKSNGRDAWVGFWVDKPVPEWPAERLGSESRLARALGLLESTSSRPLRESLAAVG